MSLSPYTIIAVILSLFAAALLGFAAHRASFCSVKAVAEIFSTRRAYMLTSFVKVALWVFAVSLPLSWWLRPLVASGGIWAFGMPAIVGGALFGVGATMNGGCAFYTLTRLSSGNLALLFTLAGMVIGYFFHLIYTGHFTSSPASPVVTIYEQPDRGSLALLAFVWLIFLWEIRRLWLSRQPGRWREQLFAKRYRLSFAAVLLGFANGLLFVFWGPWAYTTLLHRQVVAYQGVSMGPTAIQIALFFAVLAGMAFSSWQRGDGRVTFGKRRQWLVHLAGGTVMGVGAAITPGGNDALLLYGIPMLSPHALPAFLAMFAAIAVMLMLAKLLAGINMSSDCSGDVCRDVQD